MSGTESGKTNQLFVIKSAIFKDGVISTINPKETVGRRNQDAACSAALPVQ